MGNVMTGNLRLQIFEITATLEPGAQIERGNFRQLFDVIT
jgi:hypothetical protein